MALELKIRVTQIDSLFTFFNVEDENDQLDLDKQYGESGNPARNTLGLFLYVTKKEVGDAVDSIIFGGSNNTDPKTAALWQVDYNTDNWFEHVLIAAVDWDNTEAGYALNDVVYDSSRLWMSVAPVFGSQPGLVEGEWTDVTDAHEDVVNNGTGTFDYNVVLDDIRIEISATTYAKLVAKSSKNGQCLNCNHDNKDRENLIKFHLNAAQVAADQRLFLQAQFNIVTLKNICASP